MARPPRWIVEVHTFHPDSPDRKHFYARAEFTEFVTGKQPREAKEWIEDRARELERNLHNGFTWSVTEVEKC